MIIIIIQNVQKTISCQMLLMTLNVCFVDRCLSFCTFSFGYCVICSSSIYGFWLPLWYLQTLFKYYIWEYNIQIHI